jgi:hypothetical protein
MSEEERRERGTRLAACQDLFSELEQRGKCPMGDLISAMMQAKDGEGN